MRRTLRHLPQIAAALRRRLVGVQAALYAVATGQGLVEYGLVLVLIMIVCVGILTLVGNTVSTVWYDKIIEAIP